MSSASTDVPPEQLIDTPAEPIVPVAGGCPKGGSHAPIPVQGRNYSVCAKCGARC